MISNQYQPSEQDNSKPLETKCTKEFDPIGFLKEILNHRTNLAVFISIAFALGVISALSTPRKYISEAVLAPEIASEGSLSSGISTLASLSGINLGRFEDNADAIYPQIYPSLFQSTDFLSSLFEISVPRTKDGGKSMETYLNHLYNSFPTPFWKKPINSLREKLHRRPDTESQKFSKEEYGAIEYMRKNILCRTDSKTTLISIQVTDCDPAVASAFADSLCNRLKLYITDYRTVKAKQNLDFFENLYEKAFDEYKSAREMYANAADSHRDPTRFSLNTQISFLKDECDLRYRMYSEASSNLELAKIKVQETTPVFTTIQSASYPMEPSGLSRKMRVLIWMVIGLMCDGLWVNYIKPLIKKHQ